MSSNLVKTLAKADLKISSKAHGYMIMEAWYAVLLKIVVKDSSR
jgi:hypothetical protein